MLKLCDHKGIMKCYDYVESETHIYMFLEYCDGTNLLDYLLKYGAFPE